MTFQWEPFICSSYFNVRHLSFTQLSPCLFLVVLVILRVYVASTGSIPEGLRALNEDYLEVSPDASGTGFVYVCLYIIYVIGKLVMAILLWSMVVVRKVKS